MNQGQSPVTLDYESGVCVKLNLFSSSPVFVDGSFFSVLSSLSPAVFFFILFLPSSLSCLLLDEVVLSSQLLFLLSFLCPVSPTVSFTPCDFSYSIFFLFFIFDFVLNSIKKKNCIHFFVIYFERSVSTSLFVFSLVSDKGREARERSSTSRLVIHDDPASVQCSS